MYLKVDRIQNLIEITWNGRTSTFYSMSDAEDYLMDCVGLSDYEAWNWLN